jgi:hypothetical protein
MKVILQSQDKFNEIGILDLETGNFETVQKEGKKERTMGYYSSYEDVIVSFFRLKENLFLGVNKQIIQFQENDSISISSLSNNQFRFSVHRDNQEIFSYQYQRHQITPTISAFQIVNSMSEEEDFDIFLLINNVMNDKKRMERVFRQTT